MRRIAAVLVLLVAASVALGEQGGAEGKWWKRPRVAQALHLTAAQTDELEKIFAKSRPKLIDLRADFEKKQFAYEQAMEAEKVDRKAVEAAIEAREQARAKLQKELALMEIDMKQVLEPEQWEKLMQMRDEVRRRLQERHRTARERD